jgi:hypothetical protein
MATREYTFSVKRKDKAKLDDTDKSAIEGMMFCVAIDRLIKELYKAEKRNDEDAVMNLLGSFRHVVQQYGGNRRLLDCVQAMAERMGLEITELPKSKEVN